MPRVLKMTPEFVVIECEYVPVMKKKGQEEALMAETQRNYCVRCGYYRDASLRRTPDIIDPNTGEIIEPGQEFKITCINPSNPMLPRLKQELGIR